MSNIRSKAAVALAGVLAFSMAMANVASAGGGPGIVDTAISDTQADVVGWASAALTAVVAVVLVGIGIRVVPKVVRAIAARVTG